jgi:very-short-patch-repair endonuclease
MHSTSPDVALRRRELVGLGWTDRELRRAVAEGRLLKPRANTYLAPGTHIDVIDASAQGGRLACVSELARRGVFVLESGALHVHLHDNRSRPPTVNRRVRRHWGRLSRTPHPAAVVVELFDALREAVRCQPPRAAIATLDSALHLGLIREDDLAELFSALPRRFGVVRKLVDGRCESGPESLVRLILRSLGLRYEIQVPIDSVGRVDFLVEGWLIVECDSFEHHSGWEAQRRDRRRDQKAAALGYATYRPIAEDIMWKPDEVRAALAGLVRGRAGRRRP